jgi:hypothetical protein
MALSESELLKRVADAGRSVDSRRLRRWRDAGVVPSPGHLHDRGCPGSRTEYEEWVVGQVVAVADLLAARRSFRYVAVELWWAGRWVRRSTLRATLVQPLQRLRQEVERIASETGGDPLEIAEAIAEQAEREAPDHGGWGAFGARLGPRPEDRRRVNVGLALLALGEDVPWDVHDEDETSLRALFERGTGLERAGRDVIGEGPWLPQLPDLENELAELTGGLPLDPRQISQAIAEATDDELDEARDVAHWIIDFMAPAAAAQEARLGADVGGLRSIGELARRETLVDTIKLVLFGLAAGRSLRTWLRPSSRMPAPVRSTAPRDPEGPATRVVVRRLKAQGIAPVRCGCPPNGLAP